MKNPERQPNESNESEVVDFINETMAGLSTRTERLSYSVLAEEAINTPEMAIEIILGLKDLADFMNKITTQSKKSEDIYIRIMSNNPHVNEMMNDLLRGSSALFVQGIVKIHDNFFNISFDEESLKQFKNVVEYYREELKKLNERYKVNTRMIENVILDLELWIANKEK